MIWEEKELHHLKYYWSMLWLWSEYQQCLWVPTLSALWPSSELSSSLGTGGQLIIRYSSGFYCFRGDWRAFEDIRKTDIFIFIFSWKRPDSLRRLLESLEHSDYHFVEGNPNWKILLEIRVDGGDFQYYRSGLRRRVDIANTNLPNIVAHNLVNFQVGVGVFFNDAMF